MAVARSRREAALKPHDERSFRAGRTPKNLHHAARASPRCRARRLRRAGRFGLSGKPRQSRSLDPRARRHRRRLRRHRHQSALRHARDDRGGGRTCRTRLARARDRHPVPPPMGAGPDRDGQIRPHPARGRQQRRGRLADARRLGATDLEPAQLPRAGDGHGRSRPFSMATRRSPRRSPCSRLSRG